MTAIEALKKTFGKEFLAVLNEGLGMTGGAKFSYEAGTQNYIRIDDAQTSPIQILRDELNINLDRLSVLDCKASDRRNHFLGLMSVWQSRVLQLHTDAQIEDIQSTFDAIDDLLKGKQRNYRQIYQVLSKTGLGGVGALMLISGVFVATGTGVGLVSWISALLFGIPWVTVGALVLPGALLLALAAKKAGPADDISLSIAMGYKLLDRLSAAP
jgi:hypothetical protein